MLREPLELIEKLCVLVPAPRTHLRRYHGVLAPHAAWRSLIVPRPAEGAGQAPGARVAGEPALPLNGASPPARERGRLSRAALLKRVFAWDVLHGPRGGGRRRIVAVHARPETLRPLLERLGRDVPAAPTRASRSPPAPAA